MKQNIFHYSNYSEITYYRKDGFIDFIKCNYKECESQDCIGLLNFFGSFSNFMLGFQSK